jgi:hypothetical protein
MALGHDLACIETALADRVIVKDGFVHVNGFISRRK